VLPHRRRGCAADAALGQGPPSPAEKQEVLENTAVVIVLQDQFHQSKAFVAALRVERVDSRFIEELGIETKCTVTSPTQTQALMDSAKRTTATSTL
jgi:hypothetical protein